MKFRSAVLLPLLCGGIASAASIIQNESYGFVPSGTQALTFNQFDTTLGTLTSITIETNVQKSGGSLFVDNESGSAATGDIEQSVTINLSSASVSFVDTGGGTIGNNVSAVSTFLVNVGADDGDGAGFQSTGADYAGTAFGIENASDFGSVNPLFFNGYLGTGTFTINTDGSQGFDTSAIGGAAAQIDPASVSGDVTITYNYDAVAVPEPTSSLLAGLGLLALAMRRKR